MKPLYLNNVSVEGYEDIFNQDGNYLGKAEKSLSVEFMKLQQEENVSMISFITYMAEKKYLSPSYVKELFNWVESKGLTLYVAVAVLESVVMLDDSVTFKMVDKTLENLLSSYSKIFPNMYERVLKLSAVPSSLCTEEVKSVEFTNYFNHFQKADEEESLSEFSLSEEAMMSRNNASRTESTIGGSLGINLSSLAKRDNVNSAEPVLANINLDKEKEKVTLDIDEGISKTVSLQKESSVDETPSPTSIVEQKIEVEVTESKFTLEDESMTMQPTQETQDKNESKEGVNLSNELQQPISEVNQEEQLEQEEQVVELELEQEDAVQPVKVELELEEEGNPTPDQEQVEPPVQVEETVSLILDQPIQQTPQQEENVEAQNPTVEQEEETVEVSLQGNEQGEQDVSNPPESKDEKVEVGAPVTNEEEVVQVEGPTTAVVEEQVDGLFNLVPKEEYLNTGSTTDPVEDEVEGTESVEGADSSAVEQQPQENEEQVESPSAEVTVTPLAELQQAYMESGKPQVIGSKESQFLAKSQASSLQEMILGNAPNNAPLPELPEKPVNSSIKHLKLAGDEVNTGGTYMHFDKEEKNPQPKEEVLENVEPISEEPKGEPSTVEEDKVETVKPEPTVKSTEQSVVNNIPQSVSPLSDMIVVTNKEETHQEEAPIEKQTSEGSVDLKVDVKELTKSIESKVEAKYKEELDLLREEHKFEIKSLETEYNTKVITEKERVTEHYTSIVGNLEKTIKSLNAQIDILSKREEGSKQKNDGELVRRIQELEIETNELIEQRNEMAQQLNEALSELAKYTSKKNFEDEQKGAVIKPAPIKFKPTAVSYTSRQIKSSVASDNNSHTGISKEEFYNQQSSSKEGIVKKDALGLLLT